MHEKLRPEGRLRSVVGLTHSSETHDSSWGQEPGSGGVGTPRVYLLRNRPIDGLLSPHSAGCRDTAYAPLLPGRPPSCGRHAMKSSHKRGALGGLIWPGKSGKAPREGRVMQDKVKRGGESIPGRDRVLQSPPEAPLVPRKEGAGRMVVCV